MEGPVRSAETAPAGPLFDRQRMFHYPLIILAVFALGAVLLVATSRDMIDFRGKPLGYDFITFWGASDLTLEGRATDAFDPAEALKAQQKAVQGSEVDFFWHYPPTFQLVAAPLAAVARLQSAEHRQISRVRWKRSASTAMGTPMTV